MRTRQTADSASCGKRVTKLPGAETGIALLAVLFLLFLAGAAVYLGSVSATSVELQRQQMTLQALAQAKEALIGYAISPAALGQRPGDLLRPDNFATTESPPNYDGQSDSGCMDTSSPNGLPLIATGQNQRCLGRLPWQTLGMQLKIPTQNDPTGVMPWYAVSANLVDPTCLAILNSSVLNLPYSGYSCTGASLPHPWLTVVDPKGNVLSNRVAFVVIIPGPPIGGQSRPALPLAGPSAYLDSVTVLPGCIPPCVPGTYSNAAIAPGNQFIAGEDSGRVSATDPNYQQPYAFNDKLLYVTIDELMIAVEKRVGNEGRSALAKFKSNYASYPWLAPFGNPALAQNFRAQVGAAGLQGLLPYNAAGQTFDSEFSWTITGSPTYSLSGTVTLAVIASGSAGITQGTCTWPTSTPYLTRVQCTAVILNPPSSPGVAKRVVNIKYGGTPSSSWTPSPATATSLTTRKVVCTSNLTPGGGVNRCIKVAGDFSVFDYDLASTQIGTGSIVAGNGTLTTTGIRVYPNLPDWYVTNQWHQFVYGALAPGFAPGSTNSCTTGCLNVGLRTDVQTLVITAGKPILSSPFAAAKGSPGAAQTRPSGNLADYLDSVENSNGDNKFDAPARTITPDNNDMTFVIPP